jgi:hypothetical protein
VLLRSAAEAADDLSALHVTRPSILCLLLLLLLLLLCVEDQIEHRTVQNVTNASMCHYHSSNG